MELGNEKRLTDGWRWKKKLTIRSQSFQQHHFGHHWSRHDSPCYPCYSRTKKWQDSWNSYVTVTNILKGLGVNKLTDEVRSLKSINSAETFECRRVLVTERHYHLWDILNTIKTSNLDNLFTKLKRGISDIFNESWCITLKNRSKFDRLFKLKMFVSCTGHFPVKIYGYF